MQFREVEGHAVAKISQRVAIATSDLADQPLPPQLPQVHSRRVGTWLLGLSPDLLDQDRAELGIGERFETEPGAPEGRQDPHRPRRANPKPGDALPSVCGGSNEPLQCGAVQGCGQSHSLRFLEARDGMVRDAAQVPQVHQALLDHKVARIVDASLGAQHSAALVILLEPGRFVEHLQTTHDALAQDAGRKRRWRVSVDAPVEDDFDQVGAPQMQMIPEHGLYTRFSTCVCWKMTLSLNSA